MCVHTSACIACLSMCVTVLACKNMSKIINEDVNVSDRNSRMRGPEGRRREIAVATRLQHVRH